MTHKTSRGLVNTSLSDLFFNHETSAAWVEPTKTSGGFFDPEKLETIAHEFLTMLEGATGWERTCLASELAADFLGRV